MIHESSEQWNDSNEEVNVYVVLFSFFFLFEENEREAVVEQWAEFVPSISIQTNLYLLHKMTAAQNMKYIMAIK